MSLPPADPPARRRRSSQDVRLLLLDAARVEFERGGYDGATTAAIAARARTTGAQLFPLLRQQGRAVALVDFVRDGVRADGRG